VPVSLVRSGGTAGAGAAGLSPSRCRRDAAGACPTRPGRCVPDRTAGALSANNGNPDAHRRGAQHGIHFAHGGPDGQHHQPHPPSRRGRDHQRPGRRHGPGRAGRGPCHPRQRRPTAAGRPLRRVPVPQRPLHPLGGGPGAAASAHLNLNNRGQMVGAYLDAKGAARSFVKDPRGRVTTFAVPGAAATLPGASTTAAKSPARPSMPPGSPLASCASPPAGSPSSTSPAGRGSGRCWPSTTAARSPASRMRLAVAGAAVATALTVASAGASPPTPMGGSAPMGSKLQR
jgi:hypothetical protein